MLGESQEGREEQSRLARKRDTGILQQQDNGYCPVTVLGKVSAQQLENMHPLSEE